MRHVHRHPKGQGDRQESRQGAPRRRRPSILSEVARALDDAEEVLVVGPSTAKLHFVKYVHRHDHRLESKIVGLETVDHPSDGQLVAYAKHYFEAADRLR